MNEIIHTDSEIFSTTTQTPMTLPELPINIRQATMDDLPFIDRLQKKNTKKVGFLPTKALEGKIKLRQVLIAEKVASCELRVASEEKVASCELRVTSKDADASHGNSASVLPTHNSQLATTRVGYLIGNDQYYKRDDLGCIFQVNIVEEYKRHLVAASLLKAQFEASAWGCKLYCCWCAQDLEANKFWEAMGFVALAYRVGAELKGPKGPDGKPTPRVHIFWQKRIRAGDSTTPWWFPSKTAGGQMNADRIVLPIPPGVRWSDTQHLILPSEFESSRALPASLNALPEPASALQKPKRAPMKKSKLIEKPLSVRRNGLMFNIPKPGALVQEVETKIEKQPKEKAPRVKSACDEKLVTAARELRDRWLEEVNAGRYAPHCAAKYDVARQLSEEVLIEALPMTEVNERKLLAA